MFLTFATTISWFHEIVCCVVLCLYSKTCGFCRKLICRKNRIIGARIHHLFYLKIIQLIITCVVICAKNRFSSLLPSHNTSLVSLGFRGFFIQFRALFSLSLFFFLSLSCSLVLFLYFVDTSFDQSCLFRLRILFICEPIKRNNLLPESAE